MKLKGSYSSLTTYDVGDVVKYTDGNVYHLQKPCKAGVPPVETLYWGKIEQGLAEAIGYVMDMMDAESGENEKLKKAVLDIVLPLLARRRARPRPTRLVTTVSTTTRTTCATRPSARRK